MTRRLLAAALLCALALGGAACGGPSAIQVQPARSVFPAPPPNAVVLAREHGDDALALAVVPRSDGALLQASLVGPTGAGVGGARIGLSLTGSTGTRRARAVACGRGCYRASLAGVGTPREAAVVFPEGEERFALPRRWPPPDAGRLVAQADAAWRRLRTLSFREHLAS